MRLQRLFPLVLAGVLVFPAATEGAFAQTEIDRAAEAVDQAAAERRQAQHVVDAWAAGTRHGFGPGDGGVFRSAGNQHAARRGILSSVPIARRDPQRRDPPPQPPGGGGNPGGETRI